MHHSWEAGPESGRNELIDSTVVESNIYDTTNSTLLWESFLYGNLRTVWWRVGALTESLARLHCTIAAARKPPETGRLAEQNNAITKDFGEVPTRPQPRLPG